MLQVFNSIWSLFAFFFVLQYEFVRKVQDLRNSDLCMRTTLDNNVYSLFFGRTCLHKGARTEKAGLPAQATSTNLLPELRYIKGIGYPKLSNFPQLCFIMPKIKLYVCRTLRENFIQIGQEMKKL